MKHLTDEERLTIIEGTAPAETRAHVENCPACAGEVAAMQRSIRRLESMEWPTRAAQPSRILTPIFRWALAASVVLCAAFFAGRATAPDLAQFKAELARDVRAELAASEASQRGALEQLGAQQAAQLISLRRDLETLATTADASLRTTRQQLLELASSTGTYGDSNLE